MIVLYIALGIILAYVLLGVVGWAWDEFIS
jgi:hypothetical protein